MDHVSYQHQHDGDDAGGRRPLKRALLAILALLLAAGFAALGVWQVERRAWKLDLIARVEARVHAPPQQLTSFTLDPRADEYRRVRVSGTFVPGRDTFVQAVTEHGAGFWAMRPLRTASGIVLINRGFVRSRAAGADGQTGGDIAGPATVTGLLRASERGDTWLRANRPDLDRWYARDVAVIARARGIGSVAPFFIDADATPNPGGYPLGGLTVIRFNNNHLVYALTWFALAGLCGFAAYLVLRRGRAG